jgi:nitrite reductase (NADH) large subunit
MDATRAGMGCGSCKTMVREIVEWACGGNTEEDPSVHYYVPGVPLTKPELIRAIKEYGLKSVSAVFDYLAGGKEDAASKPGLASLLKTLWHAEYEANRTLASLMSAYTPTFKRTGRFRWSHRFQAASPTQRNCGGSLMSSINIMSLW